MDNMQSQENAAKVIKADERIRTLIILAYIVAVLVVVVLVVWILPLGRGKLEQTEPEVMLRIIQIVIAFIFLSIVPFGLYMFRLGWRIIKHTQMPPLGTKVIVDTKVLEGDKAVTRGKIIIAVSLVLIIVGFYGGLYFPFKLGKVFGEKINRQSTHTEQIQ
jgi:hypothetical protein